MAGQGNERLLSLIECKFTGRSFTSDKGESPTPTLLIFTGHYMLNRSYVLPLSVSVCKFNKSKDTKELKLTETRVAYKSPDTLGEKEESY